jgi:hypothetical protein
MTAPAVPTTPPPIRRRCLTAMTTKQHFEHLSMLMLLFAIETGINLDAGHALMALMTGLLVFGREAYLIVVFSTLEVL